jgi:hypothetical protein
VHGLELSRGPLCRGLNAIAIAAWLLLLGENSLDTEQTITRAIWIGHDINIGSVCGKALQQWEPT